MTEEEDAMAELQQIQRDLHAEVHEIVNILTVLKGEVDLAVDRTRDKLEAFYQRFPEFRQR